MPQPLGPDDPGHEGARLAHPASDPKARRRAVTSMSIASVFAVAGTLIFAWALRAPHHPWLFAAGALPWAIGIVVFALALWRYARS